MQLRVEQKYICNSKDLVLLQSRLRALLKPDIHGSGSGEYKVRSVYFDDYFDNCYYENEDGVRQRNKYRIRCYDNSDRVIRLEVKQKFNSYNHKLSCPLTKEEALEAIFHHQLPLLESMPEAYEKLALKMKMDLLKPKVIIEYIREAYTYPQGNVRITLDKHLMASAQTECFFTNQDIKRPLLPTGQFILEVKYDDFLPTHLYNSLGLKNLQQTACSKYYMGRTALKNSFMTYRKDIHTHESL